MLCSLAPLATAAPRPGAAPPVVLGCAERASFRTFDLPPDDALLIVENGSAAPAWLELKEAGQSIEVDGARRADRLQVRVPPRYAWSFVPLDPKERLALRRFDATHAAGRVAMALHCTLDAALQRRVDWFRAASEVSASVRAPLEEAGYARTLDAIDALRASAVDATQNALASHLLAQALLINGHNADASAAFGRVDAAWQAAGETERALAARVGRVEDANLAGHYPETLELTAGQDLRSVAAGRGGYFGVRLQASRCLALWYLDRTDEAAPCYVATLAGFERLGELPEYANVLRDYADLQLQLGRNEAAERLARHAIDLARGHKPLIIGAYLERLLGDLAMRRGAVAEALAHLDRALAQFEEAQAPRRVLANVDMEIASIYEELGAYDEALGHLSSAVNHYTMRDAPARMAGAMLRFSRLESDLGHAQSARLWARAAEAAFAALQMPTERDVARIALMTLQLADGDIPAVRAGIAALGPQQAAERISVDLLAAEAAIGAGDHATARAKLDALRRSPLTVHERMQATQVEARYWHALGATPRALEELGDGARKLGVLMRSTRSPVLAAVLARQLLPLRRLALQLLLAAGRTPSEPTIAARPTLEAVWRWLTADAVQPASRLAVAGAHSAEESFDRAIGEELVGPVDARRPAVESPARRSLLQVLAQTQPSGQLDTPRSVASLAAFQGRLPDDAAFIAYVDAGNAGALLWVTRDDARLVDAGKPDDVRAAARALRATLLTADAPLEQVDAAARRVSTELLRAVPAVAAPRRLFVLVEEPLNGIAWGVVPWRDSAALIDTSAVRLLNPALGDDSSRHGSRALHVLVAAQSDGASGLPALGSAAVEPALIRQAAAGRQVSVGSGPQFTREALLAALDDGGAWVHVAAHGVTRPERIGYAGVWLEPASATVAAQFVSWLDVLESGVRSDLVVLDACDLDDRGAALDGNLTFAGAVSRAGARWVLAAMWPVSDAAAAAWVPAFYSAQAADGDVAASLRAAQLRLRSSRAFRHPYFWAGLQATQRWPVADQGPLLAR